MVYDLLLIDEGKPITLASDGPSTGTIFRTASGYRYTRPATRPTILRSCRQVNEEGTPVLYGRNRFLIEVWSNYIHVLFDASLPKLRSTPLKHVKNLTINARVYTESHLTLHNWLGRRTKFRTRCHFFAEMKALQRLAIGVVNHSFSSEGSPPENTSTIAGDSDFVKYLLKAIPQDVELQWIEGQLSVNHWTPSDGVVITHYGGSALVPSRLEELEQEHSALRGTEPYLKHCAASNGDQ